MDPLDPLVRKLEQFAPLPETDRAVLRNAVSEVIDHRPNDDLVSQGDKPDRVHLLLDGWAGRYKTLPDGRRQIIAYLIPGDLCDVHVTVLAEMDHSIATLSPCKVAHFPRETLFDLMVERRRLGVALWWATLVDEAVLREWLVSLGSRNAEERVAHLLCEMLLRCRAVGLTRGDSFLLPLTQQQLADTMGISTVHMNRTLQNLRADGLITTSGSRMTVNRLGDLMALCDYDPMYLHQTDTAAASNDRANPRRVFGEGV